jgi:hypothetical protein
MELLDENFRKQVLGNNSSDVPAAALSPTRHPQEAARAVTDTAQRPGPAGRRYADTAIGLLLISCAVAILWWLPLDDWKAMLAVAVLLGLGLDALHAAWRDRPSLLSRLGPLP